MDKSIEIRLSRTSFKIYTTFSNVLGASEDSFMHNHNNTEVHIVTKGSVNYKIMGENHLLKRGDAVIIPPECYHEVIRENEDSAFYAFETEYVPESLIIKSLPEGSFNDFIAESEKGDGMNISHIYSFVCLFFSFLIQNCPVYISNVTDYSYLIYKFLSLNYSKNVNIGDLAEYLHLSVKQTQRVVKKFTGSTFTGLLNKQRLKIANYLSENKLMSEKEIAEYIGFNSYGYYWKAKKKSEENL